MFFEATDYTGERIQSEKAMLFRWMRYILYPLDSPITGEQLLDIFERKLFSTNKKSLWENVTIKFFRDYLLAEGNTQGISIIGDYESHNHILDCLFSLSDEGKGFVLDDLRRVERLGGLISPIVMQLNKIKEAQENYIIALYLLSVIMNAYGYVAYDMLRIDSEILPTRNLNRWINQCVSLTSSLVQRSEEEYWSLGAELGDVYFNDLMQELKHEFTGISSWQKIKRTIWLLWRGVQVPPFKLSPIDSYIGAFRIDMSAREVFIIEGSWVPQIQF